ncbi:hypothetical protein RchiOBHm_Chr4g0414811 [Rosa chinensis]|uniref:Uncharacterized protein n=1 Tax=Rosa chinensis TaxID=74649 RepID=A0A2P6QWF7_ROSCH|nr:hypothetical protein RchiOBHm_Chr4g0414811 [Rosa chinensis]
MIHKSQVSEKTILKENKLEPLHEKTKKLKTEDKTHTRKLNAPTDPRRLKLEEFPYQLHVSEKLLLLMPW